MSYPHDGAARRKHPGGRPPKPEADRRIKNTFALAADVYRIIEAESNMRDKPMGHMIDIIVREWAAR